MDLSLFDCVDMVGGGMGKFCVDLRACVRGVEGRGEWKGEGSRRVCVCVCVCVCGGGEHCNKHTTIIHFFFVE